VELALLSVKLRSLSDPLKAAHTIQKALDHLDEWSLKWRLPVNPAKFYYFVSQLSTQIFSPVVYCDKY